MSSGLRVTRVQASIFNTSKTPINKKEKVLWYLNVAGATLHGCSFIAALVVSIIFAAQSFQSELTTDFRRYDATAIGSFSSELRSLGFYPLIWIDLPFPIITCFFHALIAFSPTVWKYYRDSIFNEEGNMLRWIEYSITASLMYWVIMQLSGITNVITLVFAAVVANVALQYQGYLQEKMKTNYIPTFVGWVIFLGQWSLILSYFFTAITSPRPPGAQAAPWFVYTIVIGLFILFSIFGLIQLAYITGYPKFMNSAYAQDIAYLVMSLTAKLFLTWNLLIGIVISPIKN